MEEAKISEVRMTPELKVKSDRLASIRIRHLYRTDGTFTRRIDAIPGKDITENVKAERRTDLSVESSKRIPPMHEETGPYEEAGPMYQNLKP